MKWPVKKLCGSLSERPDEERTQTPGHEDTKRLRNVECGTAAWRSGERGRGSLYVDSRARSSELFIPGAMREKKTTTMELAQSEGRRPVNSRFAPPSPFCTCHSRKGGMVNHRAYDLCNVTRAAETNQGRRHAKRSLTPASEIGNCPTNGITNACALALDGK